MRHDKPSFTASVVAFGRGLGLSDQRRDPVARELLPAPFAQALDLLERSPRPAVRVLTLGLADHSSLRMAAIDQAVRDAVAAGCAQVVILGAGLDSRAWRMAELSGATVYEVDHPATQAYKRERVEELPPVARAVVLVPVDFLRDSLLDRLSEAGLDPGAPTVWVWEGVTMYLHREAVVETLAQVARLSAPGSHLLLSYVVRKVVPGGAVVAAVARGVFSVLGEPLLGAMDPDDVRGLLEAVSYEVESDTSSEDWAPRFGGSALLARIFHAERLAVARSTG